MEYNERTRDLIIRYLDNLCDERELAELMEMMRRDEIDYEQFESVALREWDTAGRTAVGGNRAEHLRSARKLLEQAKRNDSRRLARSRRIWIGAAASVLLLFGAGLAIFGGRFSRGAEPVTSTLSTGVGEVRKFGLPDGTQVTLNAMSVLKYDSRFGSGGRNVTFVGEAFFDVSHNEDIPFVITSGDMRIDVLGTSFSVRNYPEDEYKTIVVREGRVGMSYGEDEVSMKLAVNDKVVINTADMSVAKKSAETSQDLSWMSGKLVFDSYPLSEVAKTLQRYYGVRIELPPADAGTIISGIHDNRSLESVLKSVCYTSGLNYRRDGDRYILY